MFRKSLFGLVILAAAALTSFAQTAPVSGIVELEKDGVKTPVFNATVNVYRTDINAGGPTTTTGRRGEFAFAGLLLQGTWVLAVSAPGCQPTFFPNVKAGMEKLPIILSPGNGNIITEGEVRRLLAGGAGAVKEDPDQKKRKEDADAEKKKVEDANAKANRVNEIFNRVAKEGAEAFNAKNWDLAIQKYDEGIAADPNFVGAAPVFYNARGTAMRQRGVDKFNNAKKAATPAERVEMTAQAKKDFYDSVDSYLKSWNVLKNAPVVDIKDKALFDKNKSEALTGAKESLRVSVSSMQADQPFIDVAKVWQPDYLAAQSDPVKKLEAAVLLGDLYRVAGDSENAIAVYKTILETNPDSPEALFGAGVSLFNFGYEKSDKTMFQDGANYLQKFVSVAPDTNPYKKDALDVLDNLKKEQNVTPVKVAPPKKRP